MRFALPFVRSAGGPRINVSLVGAPSRPVIMFAHSIGCDLTLWDRQVAALKNDFHIVRYDARGHGFSGCCAVLRDCDFRAQLGDMSTPTLVIAGALDLPTPVADSEELVLGIANAKLVVLDAGHISAVEAP